MKPDTMLESGHIGRNRAGSSSYIRGIYDLATLLQRTLYSLCQCLIVFIAILSLGILSFTIADELGSNLVSVGI